jgi:hypothetical protein
MSVPVQNTQSTETSTPAAPVATETQPQEKPVVVTLLDGVAFESLLTMDAGLVDSLAKSYAKTRSTLKTVRETEKDEAPQVAKVYCALEMRLNAMKQSNFVSANKSLTEYIKDITGEKPPTHALTLKNAFGGYVVTKLIDEPTYDANSNNCLELAAKIMDACKGDTTHEAVGKAVFQLKERSKNEAKNLRAILATVKPPEKLTAEDAVRMFDEILASGHFVAVIPQLPDAMKAFVADEQKAAYLAMTNTLERIDKAFDTEAWSKAASSAIEITAAGKPVGTLSPASAPSQTVIA